MVHALSEARRVLVHGGVLIDLRPRAVPLQLEVASGGEWIAACTLDPSPGVDDDHACQEALAVLARRGALTLEVQNSFQSAIYWESPAELRAHVGEGGLHRFLPMPDEAWSRIDELAAAGGKGARIRLLDQMTIERYRCS